MKTYPLRAFVHRVLLIRLGIVAVLIAACTGLTTYLVQDRQLKHEVIDFGRKGMAVLADQMRDILSEGPVNPYEALRQVMKGGTPMIYHTGRFVEVQFYEKSSAVIAEKSTPDYQGIADVKRFIEAQPFAFPDTGQIQAKIIHIGQDFLILLVTPVTDRQGAVRAYVRGVFAISPEMVSEIRQTIIRNVVIVIAIIFIVTALLYPVILHLMHRMADFSTGLLDANLETLAVLGSAIAKRDSDTDAHNYRVSLYSARIGETVGLDPAEMRTLIKGSFLHDVGKIGIPDDILLKPGQLDENEFRIMKTHVNKGVEIIEHSLWLSDGIDVIKFHHEKYGGGGYPNNINGEQIPVTARIFAIADVFDALTSARPYKKPLSFDETMEILKDGSGTHFDSKLLDAFDTIARGLYYKYAGHEGEDLRRELVTLVEKYFSAGLEILRYGKE
jgi:HD-GYP domain-containing protein (c-di-GMP phosphodiesterase class II)